MLRVAIFGFALLLVACSTSMEDKIVVACQGYASALTTLAVERSRGNLSETVIARVEQVRAVVNPICQDGSWSSPGEALAAVERGVTNLATLGAN